jgi:hypothetical protein
MQSSLYKIVTDISELIDKNKFHCLLNFVCHEGSLCVFILCLCMSFMFECVNW